MKKIIAIIILIASIFSFNSANVFAESIMPINKFDIDLMVTDLRKSFYSEMYQMCRRDSYVKGDEKIIKAAFAEQVKIIMTMLNVWKEKVEKTRKLTTTELSDLEYIKKVLLTELNDPKRPSWTVCDTIVNDFELNIENNTDGYVDIMLKISNEYKNTSFISVKEDLSKFTSNTLSGEVAVVKDKKLVSYIKDVNVYKAIVVERTNVANKVIGYYVFLPHSDINNRNAQLSGVKISVLSTDLIFRIYKRLGEGNYSSKTLKLPVKKVGSLYYGYKLYK